MFKETFLYIDNYLNEKYQKYCIEILTEQVIEIENKDKLFKMKFDTILDELVFVILFENEHYYDVIEKVRGLTYSKISKLSNNEIEFLFLKCLDKLIESHYYSDSKQSLNINSKVKYVANELINIIKEKVEIQLNKADEILGLVLHNLREDISKFLYTVPVVGNDIYYDNYWDEFCYQVIIEEDEVIELFLKDIKNQVYKSLTKLPLKDIILLYTQTDYFIYFGSEYPSKTREEIIHRLVPKLLEDIKEVAWLADISHIYDMTMV
jgi:hypothetical protein